MNKNWAITKLNLKNIKFAYWISITVMLALLAVSITTYFAMESGTMGELAWAHALWLLPVLAAIRIPSKNFRRIVNLGSKRNNFLWGSIATYVILAAIVSLFNTFVNFTIEPFAEQAPHLEVGFFGGIANIVEVFRWTQHGAIITFFQQFAFLFLFSAFIHTMTSIQDKWYGWATDVAIVAIIAIFTPIAPLRAVLVGFFRLIIFATPLVQIFACLVIGAALCVINKPILARKAI